MTARRLNARVLAAASAVLVACNPDREACPAETLSWPTDAACFFGEAAQFVSREEHECGLATNGRVALCSWRLSFESGEWSWQYSDVGDSGTYTCTGDEVTGTGRITVVGTWSESDRTLQWDGLDYVPVCPE